jgi:pimeloyl-ACP methyl ester carboxylesterase
MLAARKPANLAGLILCASFARNPRSLLGAILCRIGFHCGIDLPPWAMRTALLNESAPSELSQLLLGAVSKVNSKVLQERLKAVLAVDVVQELDRIVVPSLYLRASDDRLVPKRAGDLIVRKRKNWQLKELAGPHLLLQAAPRQAARAIGRFIEGLSAG